MTVTADGKTCTKTGTMQVCGVECSATVPAASRVAAVVTFAGAATATSCLSTNWFEWDYGDGSTHGMSATMEHAYAATGTYTWTLEVSNFTTTCTRTGTITIGEAVACTDCGATVPAATEVGVPTAFRTVLTPTDCSATMTYRWTFGDGSTSTAANPSHTYCAVGSYSWTLTVTINGVACSRSGTITVGAPTALDCSASVGLTGACPYEAGFTGQTAGCNAQSTYAWTFGDGGTATGRTPKHMYTSQGSYDWTMATTLAGATCTRTGTVSVTAPTAIAAVGTPSTTSGAPPLAVSFTGGLAYPGCVSGATYSWAFGDGGTSPLQSPPHTYAAPGFYTWALTATADGLTHTAKGPIVVSAQAPTYTWAPQVSGTIDTIVDGTFLSQSAGWTAATRGLRRTVDGGRTWTLSRDTVAQAVRFSSATAGFYAYSCGIGRTSNGGGDWTIYPYDSCPSWSFTDIFPTSATFAWATTTQGRLWYYSLPPGSAFSYGWRTTASANLRSLWFSDAENGWAVGSGGKIIRLTGASGTATDTEQVSGTTVRLNGVRMLDVANGWIVGDGGTILHTTDGGAAWNPIVSGTTIDLLAVDFRDATNGWIVGRGGLVLATSDGGTSWTPEVNELTADLRNVSAPAGTAVYAAGVDGTLLKRLPLVCPSITIAPATLPAATLGSAYSLALAPSGGSAPYTFGVAAGSLLSGMQLSSAGALTGAPQETGPVDFTARAVDAEFCSGDRAYTLATAGACALTCSASVPATAEVGGDVSFSATASGCSGAASYSWSFGDGSPGASTGNPVHRYAAAGPHGWSVTVTVGGQSCTRSGTINVASRLRERLPRADGGAP